MNNNLRNKTLAAILTASVALEGCVMPANVKSTPVDTMRNNAYVLKGASEYTSAVEVLKAAANCKCVEGFSMPSYYFNQPVDKQETILRDVMSRYTPEQLAAISTRFLENKALANMNAWYGNAFQKDMVSTAFWTVVLAYSSGKAASSGSDATVTVGRGTATRTIGDVTR